MTFLLITNFPPALSSQKQVPTQNLSAGVRGGGGPASTDWGGRGNLRQERGQRGYVKGHRPLWEHQEDCAQRASAWAHPRKRKLVFTDHLPTDDGRAGNFPEFPACLKCVLPSSCSLRKLSGQVLSKASLHEIKDRHRNRDGNSESQGTGSATPVESQSRQPCKCVHLTRWPSVHTCSRPAPCASRPSLHHRSASSGH